MGVAQQLGIWIDNRQALLVHLFDGKESVDKIESGVETRIRKKGEGKEYTKMGRQFYTNESTKETKLNSQLKGYFERIITKAKEADSIILLGPAEAKNGLIKEISKSVELKSKVRRVETVDSMSENQVVALVKKYFKEQ